MKWVFLAGEDHADKITIGVARKQSRQFSEVKGT
jgi:hypothetical protein